MAWPPPNYHPEMGTGYQVTFDDFRQLISYKGWQPAIAPLIKVWFGYEIVGTGAAAFVRSPSGEPVDLQELHSEIQSDPRKQYDLYQNAMNFWR